VGHEGAVGVHFALGLAPGIFTFLVQTPGTAWCIDGAALQRLCSDVEQRHRIKVMCRAPEDIEDLTLDMALSLFRVAQEALTNAVRHAKARTILVELAATLEGVQLTVTDDGIGFVPADLSEHGLGLRSIDERVRLNKGEVRLDSKPGTGTTVQVRFPRRPLVHDTP
jgi:two-component system sensor histidine kinase UhpB